MSWKEKLAQKIIDGWFTKYLYSHRFDDLTEYEKQKFLNFSRGFFSITIGIANFIALFLLLNIINKKSGIETTIIIGIIMIILSNQQK